MSNVMTASTSKSLKRHDAQVNRTAMPVNFLALILYRNPKKKNPAETFGAGRKSTTSVFFLVSGYYMIY